MQPSFPHEGQTFNTDSEHNHLLTSESYEAHVVFCGEMEWFLMLKQVVHIAVSVCLSVCMLKGSNALFPDFNTLHKIL